MSISVFVVFSDLNQEFSFDISIQETTKSLKKRLVQELELKTNHISEQELLIVTFEGDVLQDNSVIVECGIGGGNQIDVELSLRGKASVRVNSSNLSLTCITLTEYLNTEVGTDVLLLLPHDELDIGCNDIVERVIRDDMFETLRLLLQRGVPQVLQNALLFAVKKNNLKAVQIMLEFNAFPDYTVLCAALCEPETLNSICVELAKAGGNLKKFLNCAYTNKKIINSMKLEAALEYSNASVNAPFQDGQTVLFKATLESDVSPINVLLKHKADPNTRCTLGTTALHHSTSAGVSKTLILHGADINAQCRRGQTPIVKACRAYNTEVARVLLESGADLRILDVYEMDAFAWARDTIMESLFQK